MQQKLVIANWKMNGDITANYNLLTKLMGSTQISNNTDIVICPPSVYLSQVQDIIETSQIKLGAQNVCSAISGAYTGEISIDMLAEFDCQYVLVGHSERRSIYNENDKEIAKKIIQIVNAKQTPVFCIGETLTQRADNETEAVILSQIKYIIDIVGLEYFKSVVIAYEPIWAIGTGQTATAAQAQEIHLIIRNYLNGLDAAAFSGLKILYGGSVNASNADELIAQPDIDGFLVGSASLKAESFEQICLAGQAKTESIQPELTPV
ncbi:triose-phosphate isomerase [Algibacillus agarilyticus]|uniref:triose-phosphate isomerase n=1 Tax=Algibacillus agarilyticus TaxID=2234133 RepID=UPI000DCFBABE|nr:triose-phosphate isomerase [Algibacillus agarilyticus]